MKCLRMVLYLAGLVLMVNWGTLGQHLIQGVITPFNNGVRGPSS